MAKSFEFRLADIKDMDLIYEWANDKLVRANSFRTEPILYEDHVKWYESLMDDKLSNVQLILNMDGIPVGQCRLKIIGGMAEIGYSVSNSYRGRGIALKMISDLSNWVSTNRNDITTLIAKVKTDNLASIAVFERCGYLENKGISNEYRQFELKL